MTNLLSYDIIQVSNGKEIFVMTVTKYYCDKCEKEITDFNEAKEYTVRWIWWILLYYEQWMVWWTLYLEKYIF